MKGSAKRISAADIPLTRAFAGLKPAVLEDIAAQATVDESRAGAFLFRAGSEGKTIHFLLRGRAKVCRADSKGKEVILGLLAAGDMVGEIAALIDSARTADIECLTNCRWLTLSQKAFLQLLYKHSDWAHALLRSMAQRLRIATERISDLALCDVNVRVAHVLVGLSSPVEEDDEQLLVISERPTHQTLASMVGASRETVTRALQELEEAGHIKVHDERVYVYSMPRI